jgi:hypothetical protein
MPRYESWIGARRFQIEKHPLSRYTPIFHEFLPAIYVLDFVFPRLARQLHYVSVMSNSQKPNNQHTATIPRISQECIIAQWEATMRNPSEVVAAETREILTRENPDLLEFINESITSMFECQMIPAPHAGILKRMMIGHTGIVYRIIRAQLDANPLNQAWDNMTVQSEETDNNNSKENDNG